MVRTGLLPPLLIGAALATSMTPVVAVLAQEADGCSHFSWDVSHELAVMKQSPKALTAATQPGSDIPQLQLDTLRAETRAPGAGEL